jgi:hypothetical protein
MLIWPFEPKFIFSFLGIEYLIQYLVETAILTLCDKNAIFSITMKIVPVLIKN